MSGIGVVHNPYARKNMKYATMSDRLRKVLGNNGTVYETGSIGEIESVAQDFIEKGYTILAINGGDGSLHLVIDGFKKVFGETPLPPVVILRGGTMNTVSNSLKLRGSPVGILKRVVAVYESGGSFMLLRQQVLNAGGKYGFMSGAGAISAFLDTYYAGRHTGVVEALKMICLLILSTIFRTGYVKRIFSPVPMKVTIDGKDPGQEGYLAVLGCVVRELGVGFAVAHSAHYKKGCFHFTATNMSPFSIILKIWSLWAGNEIVHPKMYHHNTASEVVIEPVGSLRWMLDGEMYETTEPLRITIGEEIDIVRI